MKESYDAFANLRAVASAGSHIFGAPDYLDRDKQLEFALEHVLSLHKELSRITKNSAQKGAAAAAAIERVEKQMTLASREAPSRRSRVRRANARLKSREMTFWRYLRTLGWITLHGKRHRPELQIDQADLEAIRKLTRPETSAFEGAKAVSRLLEAKDYDRAYVMARSLMPQHGLNPSFLQMHRKIHTKRGALSAVLALTREIQRVDGTVSELAVRKVEGRLTEISGWIPRISGPIERFEPAAGFRVMHLVKESRPLLSNGFTSRSQRNFEAERDAGIIPIVVTELGFPRSIGQDDFEPITLVDGIEHHHLDLGDVGLENMPADSWLEAFAQTAYETMRKVRPRVLHVSSGRRGYETALVALALKRKTGIPLVYEVRSFFESNWTPDIEWEESGEVFLRRVAVEKLCMDGADVILTLGEAMKSVLVESGIDSRKIRLIPNGVQDEMLEDAPLPPDLKRQVGIEGFRTFGYVSNMDHYRESQETLIEACAILAKSRSDVACVLVGSGPRRAHLESLADSLGIRSKVFFVGSIEHEQIANYYRLIDIFVVPRVDERAARYVTPLKPYEAMALKRPVVVSDLPALREVVHAPDRGRVFPPGDAPSLASILTALFDDPESTNAMASRGHRWVKENRRWIQNGPRYRAAFDEAIKVANGGKRS